MDEAEVTELWVTEPWIYGGVRVTSDGKRCHAWLDASGEEQKFSALRGGSIGSLYKVKLVRKSDGAISANKRVEYIGPVNDEDVRRKLYAEHFTALARLETVGRERSDAKRNALDDALKPLIALSKTMRTGAQRDALIAYVIRHMSQPWYEKGTP